MFEHRSCVTCGTSEWTLFAVQTYYISMSLNDESFVTFVIITHASRHRPTSKPTVLRRFFTDYLSDSKFFLRQIKYKLNRIHALRKIMRWTRPALCSRKNPWTRPSTNTCHQSYKFKKNPFLLDVSEIKLHTCCCFIS